MPNAARITDMHTCPMVTPGTPPIPHVGGPIIKGAPTVLTGGLPQARVSDMCVCVGPPDTIVKGSATVLVSNLPAARIGDNTAHGGVIVAGCPTVVIGDAGGGGGGGGGGSGPGGGNAGSGLTTDIGRGWAVLEYSNLPFQREVLLAAAASGTPFCEICSRMAAEAKGE
jgi:uncharacterized Zn-binding protein involved in type VI secretion